MKLKFLIRLLPDNNRNWIYNEGTPVIIIKEDNRHNPDTLYFTRWTIEECKEDGLVIYQPKKL